MAGSDDKNFEGPNLREPQPIDLLEENIPLLGHVDGQPVVLIKLDGGQIVATGAKCTHYGGPIEQGLVVDGVMRCPWHHARFDARTGLSMGGPGLRPLPCYEVEVQGSTARVLGRRQPDRVAVGGASVPDSVVIVGAGAAGVACAHTLRMHGYEGDVTLITDELHRPLDRPKLSKGYLAGEDGEVGMQGIDDETLERMGIVCREASVRAIDRGARALELEGGATLSYGALVLATGAAPRALSIEGADMDHVHVLRSLDDSRAIARGAEGAERAVVIGSSFIGLEAAASLRKRGVEVHVVAPEEIPLARVMGEEVGRLVRAIHESNGVHFHLETKPARITKRAVELEDGTRLEADLVVVGVGVTPRTKLAAQADLATQDGVVVDEMLRTEDEHIWAVGDAARYPWRGERVRIEHWALAQRHGRTCARNILGARAPFTDVPFFWSFHWDQRLSYVGHAEQWREARVYGDVEARDAAVALIDEDDQIRAVITIGRDALSLRVEYLLEREDQQGIREALSS